MLDFFLGVQPDNWNGKSNIQHLPKIPSHIVFFFQAVQEIFGEEGDSAVCNETGSQVSQP